MTVDGATPSACINSGFYAAKRRKSRPVEGLRPGTNLVHWSYFSYEFEHCYTN